MKIMTKKFIKWAEIQKNCDQLSNIIQKVNEKYDCIVSIGRGGMIPSRLVSEKLNIKEIHIINAYSYTDINKQGDIHTIPFDFSILENKNILIIDDVCTTGRTITEIQKLICENVDNFLISIVTLYYNSNLIISEDSDIVIPNLYAEKYTANDTWLVFPWEDDADRNKKRNSK